MRIYTVFAFFLVFWAPSSLAQERYDRALLFNTSGQVTGTEVTAEYDPHLFPKLFRKQHEIRLQMFDLINEAALRRDKRFQRYIDLYGESLSYIPSLAVRHYKYVFGDKSQLDWLLAEDAKGRWGSDSLIILVFAYIDEWDKTIEHFKMHELHADGAGATVLSHALRIRKHIYGEDRFNRAWENIQVGNTAP